jgi:hypothetical protein
MRNPVIVLVLVASATAGCYRVTVETGAPPAPAPGIDIPWQMSYAAGLIPPAVVDTSEECPQGVAEVRTERSFLNVLATGITSNILSPLHVTVVCAAGPVGAEEASEAGSDTPGRPAGGPAEGHTVRSDTIRGGTVERDQSRYRTIS